MNAALGHKIHKKKKKKLCEFLHFCLWCLKKNNWTKKRCHFLMNSYLQQMCLPACVLFLCVCLFFFFFLIMLLDMKRSRACAPLVLCQSYQRSLPVAGRAEYSRVDSEGSNRANEVVRGVQHWRLMGRACRAANSEAASVISRA